jgi:hypothetical protein
VPRPGAAHRVLPRRHPDHRPTRPIDLRYAGQIVTIEVDETTLRIYDQRDHLIKTIPRTSRKAVTRYKVYGRHQPQNQLGTVTHQLNPIRHPSSGTRHWDQTWNQTLVRLRLIGDSAGFK